MTPAIVPLPAFAPGSTISGLTLLASAAGLDSVDARILMAHALGWSRVELITRSENILSDAQAKSIHRLWQRRLEGVPVAYLVGTREFYGLLLEVTPDVLIPRPETELLVDLALDRLPAAAAAPTVLDLGTGSGAIAIAIAQARGSVRVTALDASGAALEVARRNASRHVASPSRVAFLESDWYDALDSHGETRFDLIVSNPPYISAGDAHLSAGDLRFEPASALTDGADGMSALRIIIGGAPRHLHAGGWILAEHGYDQAQAVRSLLETNGFDAVQSWRDLAGIERVSGGRLVER